MVGNNRAIAALNQRLEVIRNQIYLVYVTGRSYASSRQIITKAQLLKPDYLIASVGTEIYQQGVLLEKDWANQISRDWDWDAVWTIASYFSAPATDISNAAPKGKQVAVFAGGCYWGMEVNSTNRESSTSRL